ncbi:Lrp/AsnC family transcriptional regulator [archaeon]|nr:Lrp/AsnC family transcriptional regulator [archaeon]
MPPINEVWFAREPSTQPGKPIKLDKKDKEVIRILCKDARTPLTKIAKKVALTPDGVKYKINRLITQGVLQGFTAIVNPEKIGLPLTSLVLISFWDFPPEIQNTLREYIRKNEQVMWGAQSLGEWDFSLEIIAKTPAQLESIISALRKKFKIKKIRVHTLVKEYKWTSWPGESY